jgi:hypothetical protein
MQNSQNIERQNIERRINRCSFCRRVGHNRLTCDDQRLLDFELICSEKCQRMQETEFYTWLSETYEENNKELLITYAAKKTRVPHSRDFSICKDAITHYIYETYKYEYNIPTTIEDHSDNDSMPDLIEIEDEYFEAELVNIMSASLQNDISSAYFFSEIRSRRQEQSRKFAIESILQEENKMEKMGKMEEILDCCICFESYNKSEFVKLNCNHEFCNGCLKQTLVSDKRPKPCCAYCRAEVITMISRTTEIHGKMAELLL